MYVASIGSSRPPRSTSTASSIARGPPEVEQLVDRRAHAAARVEHVVDQHDGRALDFERQLGALDFGLQSLAAEIVAIERDVDEPDRMVAGQSSARGARRSRRRPNRCRRTPRRSATAPRMRSASAASVSSASGRATGGASAARDHRTRTAGSAARRPRRARLPAAAPRTPAAASALRASCGRVALIHARHLQSEAALELAREALGARASSRAARHRHARERRPPARPAAIRRSAPRSRRSAPHSPRASIVVQRPRDARASVLPTATPIRRVPKSNASTWLACVRRRCGAPRVMRARRRRTGARSRCRADASPPAAALSAGSLEQHAGIGRDGQPGVLRDLLLELPRRPAGVARARPARRSGPRRARPPRARPSTS